MLGAVPGHGDVLKNAGRLLTTTGVTSAMGFAYWTVAARMFRQRVVGYSSATVSAVTLLGTVGIFGIFGLRTVLIPADLEFTTNSQLAIGQPQRPTAAGLPARWGGRRRGLWPWR